MKVAIIQFPGSNCDWDSEHAVKDVLGISARRIWHKDPLPGETEAIIVPGGFSFGDYLRCGAIARFSPIMNDVKEFSDKGGQVLGICNGFQILCESVLLPGGLIRNDCLDFRCLNQPLIVEDSNERFNKNSLGESLVLPIAHGEGRYQCTHDVLKKLQDDDSVALRYVDNPNGSIHDIAGITNKKGNVLGMMPHPERACDDALGNIDGKSILSTLLS